MPGYKLLIAGSRNWVAFAVFNYRMNELLKDEDFGLPDEVISGKCKRGIDAMGEEWAAKHNIPVKPFPAEWNIYGKSAGPIRNKEMAAYCERAIIFWDGQSAGTKSMIEELKRAEKPFGIVFPDNHVEVFRPDYTIAKSGQFRPLTP